MKKKVMVEFEVDNIQEFMDYLGDVLYEQDVKFKRVKYRMMVK